MPYAPLTTLTSVKTWMKLSTSGDDAAINQVIPRASELIGKHCSRNNLAEVLSYSENYFPAKRSYMGGPGRDWNIVLRHYPVVALTSVILNGANLVLLQSSDLQTGASGVYVDSDVDAPRKLRFRGVALYDPGVVQVNYTAGYLASAVPLGLQQACDQYVAEILRSSSFIGMKSAAIQGETTSYDLGGDWGMSKRVQSMLIPYMNKIPFTFQ